MNKKAKISAKRKVYNKFHVPGMSYIHRVKKNAVFISSANSVKHELAKALIAYMVNKWGEISLTDTVKAFLYDIEHEVEKEFTSIKTNKKDFITEAEEIINKTRYKRDLVILDDDKRVEVECDERRAERFKSDPEKDKIEVVRI